MASSKAPTPGSTTFAAAATWAGSLVIDGLMANLLEGLLHAAQVAHAVVDDGDHVFANIEYATYLETVRMCLVRATYCSNKCNRARYRVAMTAPTIGGMMLPWGWALSVAFGTGRGAQLGADDPHVNVSLPARLAAVHRQQVLAGMQRREGFRGDIELFVLVCEVLQLTGQNAVDVHGSIRVTTCHYEKFLAASLSPT